MLAYVCDEGLRAEANARGANYWERYLEEMFVLLGAGARALPLSALEDADALGEVSALVVGAQAGATLTNLMRRTLADWVAAGGLLVGFAVEGLDRVFGIETTGLIRQQPDAYTVSGCLDLWPHPLTHEVHPLLLAEQPVLILSDMRRVRYAGCEEVARLFGPGREDLGCPAITWHGYGSGRAGYFAFDPAQTAWVLHQGRPLPEGREESGYPKAGELSVVGLNSRKVRHADELTFVLQNMLARAGVPFIYQAPPVKGRIPHALLYWGGDEYTGPVQDSLQASDFMRERGLPYHINIQIAEHPMTEADLRHIQDNGHEVSLYWTLYEHEGWRMHPDLFRRQSDMLQRKFGCRPDCGLIWRCRWKGWAEPARWLAAAGARADNSFFGKRFAFDHPLANAPAFEFGFGTSYPFYFYDDARHGNARIDVLEEPIVCYELGHHCGLRGDTAVDWPDDLHVEDVHAAVDAALQDHLVMDMFYHPRSMSIRPATCAAIDEILRYIAYRGACVSHMSNNQVRAWWEARRASTVRAEGGGAGGLRLRCRCEHPQGMVVKVLLEEGRQPAGVQCAGRAAPHEVRREAGGVWLHAAAPQGNSTLAVSWR